MRTAGSPCLPALRDSSSSPRCRRAAIASPRGSWPVLGSVAILAIGACVFLMRNQAEAFALSLAGLLLFLADMAVTLGGNVPTNKQVQSWDTAGRLRIGCKCAIDGSGCTRYAPR